MQDAAPFPENFPTVQITQLEAPEELLNLPAAHCGQATEPGIAEYEPTEQLVQEEDAAPFEYSPAPQLVQEDAALFEYRPTPQLKQVLDMVAPVATE